MPVAMADRVHSPVPTGELERRWALVRGLMVDEGVDALVVHSHVDGIGGATRWFADLPAGGGYPTSVVFPREAPMTAILHGPIGGDRTIPRGDPFLRGIGRVRQTASFASAAYCDTYDADLILDSLLELAPKRVGIFGAAQTPWTMLDRIRRGLEGVDLVDVRGLIDPIKAVKSPVEQRRLREAAAMQDAALAHAFEIAAPGMRESDLSAELMRFCTEHGGEGGVCMIGSAPLGEPAAFRLRQFQDRVIEPGDQLTVVIEASGPGGYYTHTGRIAIFGPAPAAMVEEHDFALAAQAFCVERLVDGARPAEITAAYDEYMVSHDRPAESRLLGHGQGYDLVERPLIRGDETMPVAVGMQIGVHPMYERNGVFAYVCDDYFITDDGAQRIHDFTQELIEL